MLQSLPVTVDAIHLPRTTCTVEAEPSPLVDVAPSLLTREAQHLTLGRQVSFSSTSTTSGAESSTLEHVFQSFVASSASPFLPSQTDHTKTKSLAYHCLDGRTCPSPLPSSKRSIQKSVTIVSLELSRLRRSSTVSSVERSWETTERLNSSAVARS